MDTKQKTAKRPRPISYRPPVGREQEIQDRAEKAKLSVNAFITECIFSIRPPRQARRSTLAEAQAGKMLGQLGAIKQELRELRDNLRSDVEQVRSFDTVERQLAHIEIVLTDIRWALFKLLGRKP